MWKKPTPCSCEKFKIAVVEKYINDDYGFWTISAKGEWGSSDCRLSYCPFCGKSLIVNNEFSVIIPEGTKIVFPGGNK